MDYTLEKLYTGFEHTRVALVVSDFCSIIFSHGRSWEEMAALASMLTSLMGMPS